MEGGGMDTREMREMLGTNQHFHPEKNPHPVGTPPKPHWWNHVKKPQPIQIARQASSASDGTSSPVGSPVPSSPMSANFSRQMSRSSSSDEHKDSILT